MISGTTRLFAIVGDPIAHVRVPAVLNGVFAHEGIDSVCVPMRIDADRFADGVRGLVGLQNLGGFIVTSPHKRAMVDLCDEVVGDAALVGAINTVRREPDGRLVGNLFDGRGFVDGLLGTGFSVGGKRAFVCGAGGAAHAVAFALARAGAAAIGIHNRTARRAGDLAQRLAAAYPALQVAVAEPSPTGYDLAVNATSVGLEPGDPAPFDPTRLPSHALVAEVLMKPEVTPLLAQAAAAGYRTHPGRHMLDYQVEPMLEFLQVRERGPRPPLGAPA